MTELFLVIALTAAFVGTLVFHAFEVCAWRTERAQLLDRIMARSYTDFVYATKPTADDTPQLTTDEAEAAWHEANKAKYPELYPDEAVA